MSSTANRSRLACSACTRRKVRCSKTVPCTNCVRRGEHDSCGQDETPSPAAAEASTPAPPNSELELLRRKVAELENAAARTDKELEPSADDVRLRRPPSESAPPPANDDDDDDDDNDNDDLAALAHAPAVDSPPPGPADPVMKNAASILEFLAWGRRKDPDYRSVVSPEATFSTLKAPPVAAASDTFTECDQPAVLQLLLPSPRQLEAFYARHDGLIDSPGVNLQWVALLFSVTAGALACAPAARAAAWGFRAPEERATLSRRWLQAVTTCLNRANYTANLSILSCQAIATSTIAAHLLGSSNSQSIHLAAAVRVAQSLALHRLGPEAPGTTVEKEIGRRVWCQLCSQDWFSIPFSESYLVNPAYSTSEPPSNAHDHDLVPLPLHVPTQTSYCRFLRDVAAIMPRLQDDLVACNTAYTRYEQVLAWDARLRALATAERPVFLSSAAPIEASWPAWTPWARRALAISSSHKIIMIHRSFLSDSFSNPAFAFTRRTCLAASKTIIKEYRCVVAEDGPILWIHQAFSVAAAIILILDVLHRDPAEREWAEHRDLAGDVVEILASCQNSMIASRGVKLLGALLAEVVKAAASAGNASGPGPAAMTQSRKRARDGSLLPAERHGVSNKFDVPCFVKAFCENKQQEQRQQSPPPTPSLSENPPPGYNDVQQHQHQQQDLLDLAQADFNFSFPPASLEGANGFENLLYLASHDYFSIFGGQARC